MKNFADRLIDAVKAKKSRVCVGLDPRLESLPGDFQHGIAKDIERAGKAVLDFNAALIDLVKDHAVAVKPQIAFYEKLGPYGVVAYFATCKHARDNGLLVIGDVKRGDVPDTAKAYSDAHFHAFPADAITVNPFFGSDGMAPFVDGAQKVGGGLFVLVKTSNPKSGEIQDLNVEGRPLYMHLADKVAAWGAPLVGESGYSSVGAVVGATHPKQAADIRAALPKAFFLVPGYGAQGGKAEDLKACFNPDGLGAVVNSSRGIISAWEKDPYKGMPWEKAVTKAVVDMKADINGALGL
ncbi:MAG: orotidine-5'-phosphate decarboxylase [Planctomycetaceae bacterium]|nr:orotidine-5'-phosphate decarboxylase [Planctomycetaceae bacterium]